MFGPDLMRAQGELKALFDPDNKMNPGKVMRPYRLDEHLMLRGWYPPEPRTFFEYPDDKGRFSAASRCVGVGKCRGDEGGLMCPSYRVTREEEHSTRGRAQDTVMLADGFSCRTQLAAAAPAGRAGIWPNSSSASPDHKALMGPIEPAAMGLLGTPMLVGPVAYHRLVFRRGQKEQLVRAASVMAIGGWPRSP